MSAGEWQEALQTLGPYAVRGLDGALQWAVRSVPRAEKVLWQTVDSIFAPKLLGRQLVLVLALHIGLLSWKYVARGLRSMLASWTTQGQLLKELARRMEASTSYEEWQQLAVRLDKLQGTEKWKTRAQSRLYDYKVLQQRIDELQGMMAREDVFQLMFRLRGGISRNQYGIMHEALFQRAKSGTKDIVTEYHNTVVAALNYICERDDRATGIPTEAKLAFFNEVRHAYGRTAILLSGGAGLGYYHVGVVKALMDANLLPRVFSGASAGSIIVGIIGTRGDEELRKLLHDFSVDVEFFRLARSEYHDSDAIRQLQLLVPSSMRWLSELFISLILDRANVLKMNTEHFRRVVHAALGDYTFQEAFDKTGRIINMTVAPKNDFDPPRLLNYLTAPHVLVWTACVASCSVPGIFAPSHLLVKEPDGRVCMESTRETRWSDGSIEADLPMQQLAELFNVNHFIISQVNPHAALFSKVSVSYSMWNKSLYGIAGSVCRFLIAQLRDFTKNFVDLVASRGQLAHWHARRGLAQLITQDYDGRECDITIMPWIGHLGLLRAFCQVLANPTRQELDLMTRVAERHTWPYIAQVWSHCVSEICLDRCVTKLRKRVVLESRERHGIPATSVAGQQWQLQHQQQQPERQQPGAEQATSAEAGERRGRQRIDRVPSFYTSPSLINLHGLSVADPTELDESPAATATAAVAVGGTGTSGLGIDHDDEDDNGDDDDVRRHRTSANNVYGDDKHAQDEQPHYLQSQKGGVVKSSNMALFYYQRSKSHDSLDTAAAGNTL